MGSDLISDFERIEQICKYKVGNLYMSNPPINPIFFERRRLNFEIWKVGIFIYIHRIKVYGEN